VPGERGELGLRIVIAMALLTALAWTIPMVFLGREQAEHAATITAASDEVGASGVAPMDPIGRANDARAQATLNSAIRVAQVYYAENGTYDGFGPQAATAYDPTLKVTSGPAAPGVVSMRGLTATTVVLVTATEDGGYLCAAADAEVVSFGRSDAPAPSQCGGGW
jgi:hypothetical protein